MGRSKKEMTYSKTLWVEMSSWVGRWYAHQSTPPETMTAETRKHFRLTSDCFPLSDALESMQKSLLKCNVKKKWCPTRRIICLDNY